MYSSCNCNTAGSDAFPLSKIYKNRPLPGIVERKFGSVSCNVDYWTLGCMSNT